MIIRRVEHHIRQNGGAQTPRRTRPGRKPFPRKGALWGPPLFVFPGKRDGAAAHPPACIINFGFRARAAVPEGLRCSIRKAPARQCPKPPVRQ